MDSSDLLFHLSFDNGVNAEFARGAAQPIALPAEQSRRLVPGLFGKGYFFGGKGSTIEYAVPASGGPRSFEKCTIRRPTCSGTRARSRCGSSRCRAWTGCSKPFFAVRGLCRYDISYAPFTGWGCHYGGKLVLLYERRVHMGEWMHFVLTWRKNEARGYMNGQQATTVLDTGVGPAALQTFKVACEAQPWPGFLKTGYTFADHAVMDELQIFRRPLADEEIRSLFERGHVATRQQVGNIPDGLLSKPERAYSGTVLTAPALSAPLAVDGKLDKWQSVPAQGGWIERRLGVLDNDEAKVYAACDAQNLYLAFRCPVDESLQKDPTHIWYPTGQFKAGMTARDSDVHGDDYLEFAIKNKAGHEYRIAVNAKGAVLDSRDGDKSWNTSWKNRQPVGLQGLDRGNVHSACGVGPKARRHGRFQRHPILETV